MEIDWHGLLLFSLASLALVLMPGPNTLYVMSRGLAQGRRAALFSAWGASMGQLLYAVTAALGLVVVLQQSATAYSAIKVLGAIYLIYMGMKAMRSQSMLPDAVSRTVPASAVKLFSQGFITAALNPKTAIFFVSFLPQFVDAASSTAAQMMLLYGFVYFLLGLTVLVGYAQASAGMRHWLAAKPVVQQYVRWLTGSLFIGLGVKLLAPEQR